MTKCPAPSASKSRAIRPVLQRGERGAETRLALLEAAARAIHERGYAGASIGEIVKRAGVTKGAHLHFFQTKEQLMAATIEYLFAEVWLRQERAAVRAPNSTENIERNFDRAAEVAFDWRFIALLEIWVASRTDSNLHRVFVAHEARHAAARKRLEAERWGEVVAEDARLAEIAGGMNFLLRGLFLQQILDGDWRTDPVWRCWRKHVAELSFAARGEIKRPRPKRARNTQTPRS